MKLFSEKDASVNLQPPVNVRLTEEQKLELTKQIDQIHDSLVVETIADQVYDSLVVKPLSERDGEITDLEPIVEPQESSVSEVKVLDDKLVGDINEMFSKEPDLRFKAIFKSSSKDCKFSYSVDKTIFEPNKFTMVGGGFEEKYMNQLKSMLFNDDKKIDEGKLMELLYIYNHINKGHVPICLKSKKYVSMLTKIVNVVNRFFNENNGVIRGVYTMFNSHMDTVKETQGDN